MHAKIFITSYACELYLCNIINSYARELYLCYIINYYENLILCADYFYPEYNILIAPRKSILLM